MKNLQLHKLQTLATEQRLAQAWIIAGSDSAGRLEFINNFIKWLFCSAQNRPCGNCKNCNLFASQSHPDLKIIEAKLEDIRELNDFLPGQPQIAKYKIVVISDCEQLNNYAANALLKNLEEPGSNKLFFILVPQRAMLIDTIISRCQLVTLDESTVSEDFSTELYACLIAKTMNYQQLVEKLKPYSNLQLLYFLEQSAAKLIKSGLNAPKLWGIIDTSWQMRRSLLNKQNPNMEILLENLLAT